MGGSGDEIGVRLSEVATVYCHPDIYEAYRAAGDLIGWNTSHVRGRIAGLGGLSPNEEAKRAAVAEFKAAENAVIRDLINKMRDGRLVAMGFVMNASGRDPDASRRKIPDDVLSAKDFKIRWQTEAISGNSLTYVSVELYSECETPAPPPIFVGCTLAECFERIVVDDWVRQELAEFAFKRFPDWQFSPEDYGFNTGRWPVRYEDWGSPGGQVSGIIHPVVNLDDPDPLPKPPEAVTQVRFRIEAQLRRLLTWLRDASLCAEGIKEPKDHDLARLGIPSDWWRQADVTLDVLDSSLWIGDYPLAKCVFSDIRNVPPEVRAREQEPLRRQRQPSRSKGTPGRKPKWDWEAATREMIRLANSPDGLPYPQSKLEDHVTDWFMLNFGDSPAESTIRSFVTKYLPPDYR